MFYRAKETNALTLSPKVQSLNISVYCTLLTMTTLKGQMLEKQALHFKPTQHNDIFLSLIIITDVTENISRKHLKARNYFAVWHPVFESSRFYCNSKITTKNVSETRLDSRECMQPCK